MDGKRQQETKEANTKCCYLFNCDKTYDLDVVKNLLAAVKEKSTGGIIDLKIEKEYFRLFQMSELSETIKSRPPMDYAIFVVNAHESRLSINEDNAGIGYAKIYRALLQATGDKVLLVIGGDDNYRDAAEEERSFLSRWARRQVSSQFKEEFMDGRKSFIFSWDTAHRAIHEEALLHFLDPGKEGQKFVREQKPTPDTRGTPVDYKQTTSTEFQESSHIHEPPKKEMKCSNTHTAQAWDGEPKSDTFSPQQPTDTGVGDLAYPGATPTCKDPIGGLSSKPETVFSQPAKAMGMDLIPPTPGTRVVILGRDESDGDIIRDLLGDEFLKYFFSGSSEDGKNYLQSIHSIRSCFIVVEAETILDEHKSLATHYKDLLLTARERVETKVVVIVISSDNTHTLENSENAIKSIIELLLGDKGVVLWMKGNSLPQTQTSKRSSWFHRSKSVPEDAAKRSTEFGNISSPGLSTLLLKTRLRYGRISYDDKDLDERWQGWIPPKEIADDLRGKWHSTINAELLIYRENETGKYRVVVNDGLQIREFLSESFKDAWQNRGVTGCFPFLKGKRDTSPLEDELPLD